MGPIIVIEDDIDDQDIIKICLKDLGVEAEVKFFTDSTVAFEYITRPDVVPSMILSDINLPIMNGFQLRDKIHADEELRLKCIPYIFITTGGEMKHIWQAYSKNAQGFFIKPNSMDGWRTMLDAAITYWKDSKKPRH